MSRTLPTNCSKLILPDLDLIASETKLVIRKSPKFSPDGFIQTLLSSVATGQASSNQIAADLKTRVDASMARQSMHERFTHKSTAFLLTTLGDLMKQRFAPTRPALEESEIKRIVVQDSSGQVMPKSNSENFPAHGNHHGATAGVKIDFAYDLLAGEVISHILEQATTQDKVIGKEVIVEIGIGDLVLRDMGYFILDEFTAIEERGAWWLTRLPLTTNVFLESGKSLEKLLNSRKNDVLDLTVLVGEQRKKCRLVAVRAERRVVDQRRADRRKRAREKKKAPCRKGLIRDGWHLMLTNLKKEDAGVGQLVEVYRSRWAVEIQFRAWKQSLNLTKALNRKSNQHHMEAIVLAGMIAHQLGMRIAKLIGEQVGRARLSHEKLYDLLANHLIKAAGFSDLIEFRPDLRHISRDKRTRQSPIESGLNALA